MSKKSPNYVAKLDQPKLWDTIKTNIETESELKKVMPVEYSKYVTIWNLVKPKTPRSDITFVGKQLPHVMLTLCAHYGDSPNATKVGMMCALANILLSISKQKYKNNIRVLFVEAKKLQQDVVTKNKDNKMTERERHNFVCFQDLQKQRQNLWEFAKANPKRKYIQLSLILALNTLIPPLRLNWLDVRFTKRKPPAKSKENWLWDSKEGYVLILNHDKVSNKIGKASFNLLEVIPGVTDGATLSAMIRQSLEWWPRDYVLAGIHSGKPLGVASYNSALRACFSPKKPTQNLLRKIYVNHFYGQNISQNVKEQIAKRMRHSTSIADQAYRKVDIVCEEQDYEPIQQARQPAPQPIVPKTSYFDPKAYGKAYRLKNKDKLKALRTGRYEANKNVILKAKLIRSYNLGQSVPKQKTLDLYGIVWDGKRYA